MDENKKYKMINKLIKKRELWQVLKYRMEGLVLEIQLLNGIYNLYLMLIGGYIILAIGSIGYIISLHKLYKQLESFEEMVQQEIIDQLEINKTSNIIEE